MERHQEPGDAGDEDDPSEHEAARRIQVEEGMLRQGLGPDYDRYAASRKRLVPGVW